MRDSIETTNVQGSRNAKATEASFDTFTSLTGTEFYTHTRVYSRILNRS